VFIATPVRDVLVQPDFDPNDDVTIFSHGLRTLWEQNQHIANINGTFYKNQILHEKKLF
jgi:hypothetical protein